MWDWYDIKKFFKTPSKDRTKVFIVCGVIFGLIVILSVAGIASSNSKNEFVNNDPSQPEKKDSGEGVDTGSEGGDTGSEGGDTGSEGGDSGSGGGEDPDVPVVADSLNVCGFKSNGKAVQECSGGYLYDDTNTEKTVNFVLKRKWNFIIYSLDMNKKDIVLGTLKKLVENKVSVHLMYLEDHRYLLSKDEGGYGLDAGPTDMKKVINFITTNKLSVAGVHLYMKPEALSTWSWDSNFDKDNVLMARYIDICKQVKSMLVEQKLTNIMLSSSLNYKLGDLFTNKKLNIGIKDLVNAKCLDMVIPTLFDGKAGNSASDIKSKIKPFVDNVWTVAGVGMDSFGRRESSMNSAITTLTKDSVSNVNYHGACAFKNTFYTDWTSGGGGDEPEPEEEETSSGGGDDPEPEVEPEPEGDIDMSTPFGKYLASKKYLYVWGYPDTENFVKFVRDQRFKRIYIYIGCMQWDADNLLQGKLYSAGDSDIEELIPRMRKLGVEVELVMYVNDGVNNMNRYEEVETVAQKIKAKQSKLDFSTLHFDQEPSSIAVYPKLLDMFDRVHRHIRVSTTLKPKWLYDKVSSFKEYFNSTYYEKFKDCETMADAIMKVVDSVDLMAYSSSYSGTRTLLDDFKTIIKRHPGVEAKPAFELDPNEKLITDSIYFRYVEDHDKFFNFANGVAEEFDGLTYHQYQVWNKDLYCEDTKRYAKYYFGYPKKC